MVSPLKHSPRVIAHHLAASGAIPNHSRWPLLIYTSVVAIAAADPAADFEALFDRNGWPAAWRNGVHPKYSKPILDEIDTVLTAHYGFTEEELDFILNYDIKYRLGHDTSDGEVI